jgi:hypothetical protein
MARQAPTLSGSVKFASVLARCASMLAKFFSRVKRRVSRVVGVPARWQSFSAG